ncbi:hypothetical protein Lepto7375DRAFT_7361 [Leptolyngbya sp. PCC 7375]|nr:hypothetical protein Lepto7375DRAFT_7361 [Leptolyngbya sp. PCC 7375]
MGERHRTASISPDLEYIKVLKKRIDIKVSKVIRFHLYGEVLTSVGLVVLISLKTFQVLDCIVFLLIALGVVWLQRYVYIFYLSNLLPELVTKTALLGEEYTHQAFEDKEEYQVE